MFLKKKECNYDHKKFDRFVFNDISVLIERDALYDGPVRGCGTNEKPTEK